MGQSGGESCAPFECLSPGVPDIAIDNGRSVPIDNRRAFQEADWRERDVVRGAPYQPLHGFRELRSRGWTELLRRGIYNGSE